MNTHPIERLLQRLAGLVRRHRGWFVYPQIVLCGVAVVFTVLHIKFKTDANDLVSPDADYQQQWQALRKEFHSQDDLVTLAESENPESNRQFVERLAARLEAEPEVFANIFCKGDLRAMGPKALLLLPEPQLERMLKGLREYRPFVGKFVSVTNLSSLLQEVEAEWRAAITDRAAGQQFVGALPALTRIVQQGGESLQRVGVPPSPGMASLVASRGDPSMGGYLQFAAGRIYILTCTALDDAGREAAVVRLRELVDATRAEVPGVNAGVTGKPVLRLDEMMQAKSDTARASVIAFIIVALTFIACYQQVARPLKAAACLLVGIAYTLGFATLTVGHLNILTITLVPILIGLAIDFGVHLIARFEEELREGQEEVAAMTRALVGAGTGIFTSGLTTAAAFLAMIFTGFTGISEMGLIAGGGLLLCLVPMITMLPAMLLQHSHVHIRIPKNSAMQIFMPRRRRHQRGWHEHREAIEQVWLRRPRFVVWLGGVLMALAILATPWLGFDYNPLNLQSQTLPAVMYEHRLLNSAHRSILSCAVMADSLEDALALETRLRRLDTVADVDSAAPILAGNQDRKLELVRQISEAARAIEIQAMDQAPVDIAALDKALENVGRAAVGAMQFGGEELDKQIRDELYTLREAVGSWRAALAGMTVGQSEAKVTQYQQALFRDWETTLTALQEQQYGEPLRVQDLPAGLRSRFIGRTGKYLLQVYPHGNIWEHEAQKEFVRELRTVDPGVTGSPVLIYENTRRLKSSFQVAAAYALLTITLMLLLHFRNVVCVLLALLPVAVGILWTFGLMVAFGMTYNPVNIIAPTLLIGIGVTNGIHILNRFTAEQHPTILGKSTGKAVLVSALTTITGFGCLMLAKHQGIASLGVIMAIGTGLCMFASVTILPALLIVLTRSGFRLGHGWLTTEK